MGRRGGVSPSDGFELKATTSIFLGLFYLPVTVFAHHSFSAWFDRASITELEGELTEVRWQNPHVRFTIRTTDESGQETLWDTETFAVSGISRWGITPEHFSVGDRVRVAGNPSKRGENQLWIWNILLPSGEELLFGEREPRWSDRVIISGEPLPAREGESWDPSRGIFRVWSTGSGTPFLLPEVLDPNFDFSRYPLTDAARSALAAFDPFEDDPTVNCVPKGMPAIMEQPYPMEFIEQDGNILLHIEEYDLVRSIHMGSDTDGDDRAASSLGYSVGRWEGSDLIVTTTNVNWGYFDSVGIPLSTAAVIVERFTPTDDGARLDYHVTVTDPSTFTEPVELGKYWIWRSDIEVGRYECVVDD